LVRDQRRWIDVLGSALLAGGAGRSQSGGEQADQARNPHRALSRLAIERTEAGATDQEFTSFARVNFQLAFLTQAETVRLNKLSRSRVASDRLTSAKIARRAH